MIKVILTDVGGVLLTNGWDHHLRQKVAQAFGIDFDEMQSRHEEIFDLFERGKVDFDTYLEGAVFYKARSFSKEAFKKVIFESAEAYKGTIDYLVELKKQWQCRLICASNEGRDLAIDRIQRFAMKNYIDFFIFSSFIQVRKPEPLFYQTVLDLIQEKPEEILYIDDRDNMITAAQECGIQAIHHTDLATTRHKVDSINLSFGFKSL